MFFVQVTATNGGTFEALFEQIAGIAPNSSKSNARLQTYSNVLDSDTANTIFKIAFEFGAYISSYEAL